MVIPYAPSKYTGPVMKQPNGQQNNWKYPLPQQPSMPPPPPYSGPLPFNSSSCSEIDNSGNTNLLLQTAFKISLSTGQFVDTKFYAFSHKERKSKSGVVVVDRPLPIYASSYMLRAVSPYIAKLLDGTSEADDGADKGQVYSGSRPTSTTSYDYNDDSDLEEDGEGEVDEDDDDVPDTKSKYNTSKASSRQFSYESSSLKEVHIPDAAHATWTALIFYLCTGEVSFKPLKSPSPYSEEESPPGPVYAATACSPKSIYRLADKLGLEGLKEKAREEILNQIGVQNILPEIFSEFTSRYPQINQLELDFLCEYGNNPIITSSLPEWVDSIATGKLPHSAGVLKVLLPKLLAGQEIKPQPPSVTFQSAVFTTYPSTKGAWLKRYDHGLESGS